MCAYMNQERKQERLPEIKKILNKYGMKGSVKVRNNSTLVVTLKEGKLDIIGNFKLNTDEGYIQVNQYYIDKTYSGKVRDFLEELKSAMLGKDYYCNDNIMVDYFDRSHYIEILVGTWDKPYICTK